GLVAVLAEQVGEGAPARGVAAAEQDLRLAEERRDGREGGFARRGRRRVSARTMGVLRRADLRAGVAGRAAGQAAGAYGDAEHAGSPSCGASETGCLWMATNSLSPWSARYGFGIPMQAPRRSHVRHCSTWGSQSLSQ